MQQLNDKIPGSTLTADEWNEAMEELQNVITDAGQALDGGDLTQVAKAIIIAATAGSLYEDSGAADAYVLARAGGNNLENPISLFDGMRVDFEPTNNNTGASTVNINSLGVTDIQHYNGKALQANDLVVGLRISMYYDSSATAFKILGAANVGFFHDDSNSFSRSARAKMSERISITDFYDNADGSNYSPALGRALDYAILKAQQTQTDVGPDDLNFYATPTVWLPQINSTGTYDLDTVVNKASAGGIRIEGEFVTLVNSGASTMLAFTEIQQLSIKGIAIDLVGATGFGLLTNSTAAIDNASLIYLEDFAIVNGAVGLQCGNIAGGSSDNDSQMVLKNVHFVDQASYGIDCGLVKKFDWISGSLTGNQVTEGRSSAFFQGGTVNIGKVNVNITFGALTDVGFITAGTSGSGSSTNNNITLSLDGVNNMSDVDMVLWKSEPSTTAVKPCALIIKNCTFQDGDLVKFQFMPNLLSIDANNRNSSISDPVNYLDWHASADQAAQLTTFVGAQRDYKYFFSAPGFQRIMPENMTAFFVAQYNTGDEVSKDVMPSENLMNAGLISIADTAPSLSNIGINGGDPTETSSGYTIDNYLATSSDWSITDSTVTWTKSSDAFRTGFHTFSLKIRMNFSGPCKVDIYYDGDIVNTVYLTSGLSYQTVYGVFYHDSTSKTVGYRISGANNSAQISGGFFAIHRGVIPAYWVEGDNPVIEHLPGNYYVTSIPTAGAYIQGDKFWDTSVAAGGKIGWVATADVADAGVDNSDIKPWGVVDA